MWVQDQEVSYPFGRKAPQKTYGLGELEEHKIRAVRQKNLNYLADKKVLSEQINGTFPIFPSG